MLGSCSSTQSEKLLDETPITIKIPSKISNDILSITLPKCAFFLNERERKALDKGELTTEKVVFKKLYSQAHISQQLSDMSNFNKRFSR